MEQVLLNLVIDVEQAMSAERGEGTLRVSTAVAPPGVRIEVADDGPGIASAHIDRIFDLSGRPRRPARGPGSD